MTTEREDGEPRDERLSARYRELAREEPSARLDAAILGAARARTARPGRSRWAAPVSIAAVLVLSVLVTTRIHEEAPKLESAAPAPAERAATPARPAAPAQAQPTGKTAAKAAPQPPRRSQSVTGAGGTGASADAAARSVEKREPIPFTAQPQAAPGPASPAEAEAARPAGRNTAGESRAPAAAGSAAAPAATAGAPASAVAPMPARERSEQAAFEDSPQKWLEHIARLRDEGRDPEADESFARFRRRYPDYRVPEAMRAKVLPR